MVPKSEVPKIRVLIGEATALGPGKADLLDAIVAAGSISGAARRMGMSYRRAWVLVDRMNKDFKKPVVLTAAGGPGGGGAVVTPFGERVLDDYRNIEAKAASGVSKEIKAFAKLLRRPKT